MRVRRFLAEHEPLTPVQDWMGAQVINKVTCVNPLEYEHFPGRTSD